MSPRAGKVKIEEVEMETGSEDSENIFQQMMCSTCHVTVQGEVSDAVNVVNVKIAEEEPDLKN